MDIRKESNTQIRIDPDEVKQAVFFYIERQGVKLPQNTRYYFHPDGSVAVWHDE